MATPIYRSMGMSAVADGALVLLSYYFTRKKANYGTYMLLYKDTIHSVYTLVVLKVWWYIVDIIIDGKSITIDADISTNQSTSQKWDEDDPSQSDSELSVADSSAETNSEVKQKCVYLRVYVLMLTSVV